MTVSHYETCDGSDICLLAYWSTDVERATAFKQITIRSNAGNVKVKAGWKVRIQLYKYSMREAMLMTRSKVKLIVAPDRPFIPCQRPFGSVSIRSFMAYVNHLYAH